jgi:hypothetical protein
MIEPYGQRFFGGGDFFKMPLDDFSSLTAGGTKTAAVHFETRHGHQEWPG